MKKYIQTDELQKLIDWDNILKMPRYAGGHDAQMKGLFKNVEVLGHWNKGDYQGMVATCVKFTKGGKFKGKYAIYNDYYGSCSGCDAWEDASNEEVTNMCIGLANSAYVFKTLEDVIEFLQNPSPEGDWTSWSSPAIGLLSAIQSKS